MAYAELGELALRSDRQVYVQARKAEFETRTGTFSVEDPWYEARIRAFHDDLLTQGASHASLLATVEANLAEGCQELGASFRGLFHFQRPRAPGHWLHVVNLIDHAEYYAVAHDALLLQALDAIEEAVVDARVVASDRVLAILPGAFVHPEEATQAIEDVVRAGVNRGLPAGTLLDRLMQMEHQLRVRSRVRPNQVYRVNALHS